MATLDRQKLEHFDINEIARANHQPSTFVYKSFTHNDDACVRNTKKQVKKKAAKYGASCKILTT